MPIEKIISFSELNQKDVSNIFRYKPTVVCGSAISILMPTGIQSGITATWNIAKNLCSAAGIIDDEIINQVASSAFEVLVQERQNIQQTTEILSRYFQHSPNFTILQPNSAHIALARLFAEQKLRHIITPNYDEGLEKALEKYHSDFNYCIRIGLPNENPDQPILLKIHGTASQHDSLVFTLDKEGVVPAQNRGHLRSMLGPILIVVGYSGRDFDICPEIYAANIDHIYWIARPKPGFLNEPEIEPLAREILNKHSSTIICGDLYNILNFFVGLSPPLASLGTPDDLSEKLFSDLSMEDRNLWAASVFGNCSIPTACRLAAEARGGSSNEIERLYLETGGLHAGRFLDQANRCTEDAQLANSAEIKIERLLGACGAYGMGGYENEARSALVEAIKLFWIHRRCLPISTWDRIKWLHILHFEDTYKEEKNLASDLARRPRRLKQLHRNAQIEGRYGQAATLIDWLWSKDKIELNKSGVGELIREAEDLYGQLGNYVGQVTKMRLKAYRNHDKKLAQIMLEQAPKLRKFGLFPELFRVYHVSIHFECDIKSRKTLFQKFKNNLSMCQMSQEYKISEIASAHDAVHNPQRI